METTKEVLMILGGVFIAMGCIIEMIAIAVGSK